MSQAKLIHLALIVVSTLLCPLAAAKERSYVASQSCLILDGVNCGLLRSVDGGSVSAEVIDEPAAPAQVIKKHLGQPKYEAFAVEVGFGSSAAIYEWIQQSWAMKPTRKGGSIVAMDSSLTPKSERQFLDALITETTIPAVDGSSKEPAYLTLQFAPEVIRSVPPSTKVEPAAQPSQQKMFLPCNFRLEIDGIDCSKVSRVESFTVKQTMVTDAIGDIRSQLKQPGKLEFPNLKITVGEAGAQPFVAWHEDFVIKGNNDQAKEKGGSLALLSPDGTKVLARIKFFNLGIFRLAPAKLGVGGDPIARVEVELYVERMEFLFGEGTEGGSPSQTPAAPRTIRRG